MYRLLILLVLGGAAWISQGCSMKSVAVGMTADIMMDGQAAMEEEQDLEFAESSMPASIKMIEGLLKADPGNQDLLIFMAKSYGGYAFAFMEDRYEALQEDSPQKAKHFKQKAERFYSRGKKYALQVLKYQNWNFKESLSKDFQTFEKSLEGFSESDAPALFWTAYNWGNWINLNLHSPEAIADAPKMEKLMSLVLQMNESFYFAGPHLFYGAYYGGRPPMLGGNLEKSKAHFEKALQLTDRKFLITHVLYAQYYAVQKQDQILFQKLLKEVLDAPDDIFPEQGMVTQLAKQKARRLSARQGALF